MTEGNELDKITTSDLSKIQVEEPTSLSLLNEVSTCPDFTFTNSLRSPEGPMRGRSVKEFEEQLRALKKENWDLKVRIYLLEERMGDNFNLDKENIIKNNVELMVEIESLKKELQEKHELLCQAVRAMDLEEDEFKKTVQSKNDEIIALKQEVEECKIQIQDGKYDNDNESSHRSYHSDGTLFSSQVLSLPESSSRLKILQDRISSLENELTQEKENSASLQMILDQADVINTKYEKLRIESETKDEQIKILNQQIDTTKDEITKLNLQMSDLEKSREQLRAESQKLSKLVAEKSTTAEEMVEHLAEVKRKYGNLKNEFDKERQRFDKNKFVNDMKVNEMEEELEKQKGRVQDLQKKLGLAHQELKENQNLLVPKSPKSRSIVTNTDCDNVSVPNAATSLGVPKEDALRDALACKSPSKSPVAPKTFDFDVIYKILNTVMFSSKPQFTKHLDQVKDALYKSELKIVHLKAQELKACAIIKNLMQYRKSSEKQIEDLKRRISQLEKELEGVVSKPEGKQTTEDGLKQSQFEAFINELENKIKILELTLKEKDIHVEFIEAQNLELINNRKIKEKEMFSLEKTMSTQDENAKEAADNLYSKLFDEKNKEIEKLNEELRKRTYDLQAVVNNELWQKNREIEKLQIKYAHLLGTKESEMTELKETYSSLSTNLEELKAENEEKHVENSNLKIDISDLKLQLQLLKDKIGEIGLISDDKLEVEIIISSLDDVKNIQKELEDVKHEKAVLTKKINELENVVQMNDVEIVTVQEKEMQEMKKHLEVSEALRTQSNRICHVLRVQLEELAVFLDSLMKQKSVLGFLGNSQNKKLREAIDHSLDLSKSIDVSVGINFEQSLMQLSNITALLNGSDVSNVTANEDSCRYSFSIIPDQATLTYQSHIFKVGEDNADNKLFTLKSLQERIEMLNRELKIKNNELNRLRRESKSSKDLRLSLSKPRISPNKLKTSLTIRNEKFDSESETWSEPDVNVSKARIGLFKENNESVAGVEEILSSDSTDESITNLSHRGSDILNECQLTITKLNKQVQDLQAKLQEKEHCCIELREANEMNVISLKEDNELLKSEMEKLHIELEQAHSRLSIIEDQKQEVEKQLELLRINIETLEVSKKELVDKYNTKDKEMCNKINQMKFEREQLVNMAKEYANMTENSRQEIMVFEKKVAQLTIEKENIEKKLRKEYENNLIEKLRDSENEFKSKLQVVESTARKEIEELNEKVNELTKNYSENYVMKSQVEGKIDELKTMKSDVEVLKKSLDKCRTAVELSRNNEKKMKEEIDNLRVNLHDVNMNYSKAVSEKSELEENLNQLYNRKTELEVELSDIHQELSLLKEQYQKETSLLQTCKSKLELKMSELEFNNADLHNRLVKLQYDSSNQAYNTSPTVDICNRSVPINQVSPYLRQISNSSQSYVSEDEVKTRGVFSIVVPQKSIDSDRIEASSSPDLGIESDQGRFSSLELQMQPNRPLLQTIEITQSMSNLLDGDHNVGPESICGNKTCYQKSVELSQENNTLKKKLIKTKKALEDTVTQLTLANQRKKQIEKNICRQIHKTSQVLREAKANLDSGSEADFHKK